MNKKLFSKDSSCSKNKPKEEKMKIFYENFTCANDVFDTFCVAVDNDIEFIYADYDTPAYEGYAHVIFMKNRVLYEVNASHCSCGGLEDQWRPEETSLAALMFRPNVSDNAKANLKQRFKNLIAFL